MNFSQPTLPSRASRFPALRSRGSCRGFAIHEDRALVFESHLELMVLLLLAIRPDVVEIFDQPPSVTYVDDERRVRKHTFDFMIVLNDGTKILIAVKPREKVASSGIGRTIELVATQLEPGIANKILLIADDDFTRIDRHNAQLMFECSRFPIAEHDELIKGIIEPMQGSVKIGDLVEASGLGGLAFRAVVRCIARGQLAPVTPQRRITPETYVNRRLA